MEVVGGFQAGAPRIIAVEIADPSQVSEVRRTAAKLATDAGLDETQVGRVSIVATELGTNILKHATRGEIIVRSRQAPDAPSLELVAIDSGPGISDIDRALRDGYSTAGSHGHGLGALRRLTTNFDVFTAEGRGTVFLARVDATNAKDSDRGMSVGVVRVPKAEEQVCGDDWSLTSYAGGASLVVVADGLGHGLAAADAAGLAVRAVGGGRELGAAEAMTAMNAALRSTRGAAAATAFISADHRSVRFSGVGNISASIVERGRSKTLVSHTGIVGHNARRIQEFEYAWPSGSLLVMHSDGVSGRWNLDDYPGLISRDPSIVAAVLYRDFSRRRDDSIVVVARALN